MDMGERGGKGEMYDENNVEIYVTLCKIDSQQEFVVCSVNLGGGDGDRREVQKEGNICITISDSC